MDIHDLKKSDEAVKQLTMAFRVVRSVPILLMHLWSAVARIKMPLAFVQQITNRTRPICSHRPINLEGDVRHKLPSRNLDNRQLRFD
jgi:hypothetical protein